MKAVTLFSTGAIALLALSSCKKEGSDAHADSRGKSPDSQTGTTRDRSKSAPASKTPADFRRDLTRLKTADLEALWRSLDSAGLSKEEKVSRQCQIIERLTQIGDFEGAMKLAMSYGQGELRSALMFSLVSASPEPLTTLLERLKNPVFSEGDRNSMLRGIARNIGSPGGLAKVTALLATKPALSTYEVNAIGSGIAASIDLANMGIQYYADPTGGELSPAQMKANYAVAEATLKEACAAYPEQRERLVQAFLMQGGDVAPFECWKTLADQYGALPNGEARLLRMKELAEYMFAEDPRQALTAIEGVRGKSEFPALLREGVASWARSDINAVETWFADSSNGLSKSDADQVAHGVARFLGDDDRPAEGWKWVGKIADPEVKRKAEGQVWQLEKRMVTGEAKDDPQQLVESIVAGSSQHAAYWIEIGMNEWVARDAEAARKWYEAKGSSLTPQQNEAVALSYARLALANGQVEEATRWAGEVVTPKFKNKIEAEIKQAGNEGG